MATAIPQPPPAPAQVRLVLSIVLIAYLGQMTLTPIIAPFARESGLAEWQIGVTISAAALMVVATSQFWGTRAQSWGSKRVLVSALAIAFSAMTLFAVLAGLGTAGIVTGVTLFALFLLVRGILFGGAISAIAPTAQTFITGVTHTEAERVRGLAGVGAVQGIAMIGGSVVGGLLAGFGILVAIWAVPALLAIALILTLACLRPENGGERLSTPVRVRPFDRRVFPYLLAGFGLFTALGFIQILTGFIIQDRYQLGSEQAGLATGGAMLAAGIGMVLAQAVIVPRLRASPASLIRIGAPLAMLGFIGLIPSFPFWATVVTIFVIGLGMGIATPGYTAGPTLNVSRAEQGGLAGLIGATNGLTFVIAPTLGTALYTVWAPLPVIAGGIVLATVSVHALTHPGLRAGAPTRAL